MISLVLAGIVTLNPRFFEGCSENVLQRHCVGGLKINKAYRPNAHLLSIVMHYNGSII